MNNLFKHEFIIGLDFLTAQLYEWLRLSREPWTSLEYRMGHERILNISLASGLYRGMK